MLFPPHLYGLKHIILYVGFFVVVVVLVAFYRTSRCNKYIVAIDQDGIQGRVSLTSRVAMKDEHD